MLSHPWMRIGWRALPSWLGLCLASSAAWALTGCSSGPEVRDDPPPSAAAVSAAHTKSASVMLGESQEKLTELGQEVDALKGRVGSALSAVNWNLMRYPQCVDQLFHTAAELDLGQEALRHEHEQLSVELRALRQAEAAGRLNYEELTRVSNRIQHAQDRVTMLNAELAMLFSRTMRKESPCDEATAGA